MQDAAPEPDQRRPAASGRDATGPSTPVPRGPATPAAARVLALQRSAGNRAVAHVLANRAGTVQRSNEAAPGQVEQAANDLQGWLVANAVNVPSVLLTLLLQKDHRDELRTKYQDTFHRVLLDDLKAKLRWDDVVRATSYLNYGQLRTADKIYIAIHGVLTDSATLARLMPMLHEQRDAAENDFTTSYTGDYPTTQKLPNGADSRIWGAIMQESGWMTPEERIGTAAVLAFGTTRAADDVRVATVTTTNNSTLLFNALERQDPAQIATDFQASYTEKITDYLSREASFHTKKRALMFFDPNVAPEDRLIRTVEIATSGYTTADADFIFDALAHATDAQLSKLKAAIATVDPRVSHLDDTFGGLNKEQRDHFNALVGIGDAGGILDDPAVKMLRQEGGNGSDSVFPTLKNSTGAAYATYKAAYAKSDSPFRQFVDPFCDAPQKGWLLTQVFADFTPRLHFVMDDPGAEEYLLFLISSFADTAKRKELAGDADFGSRLAKLSTSTQNKVQLALEPQSLTPQERAVWLDAAIKRETASGVGSLSATAGALDDENRELQAAVARGGKNPTPEQQADIDRLAGQAQQALESFVKYRDELESILVSAAEMAASIVATVVTGGAASIELVVGAMARAAVAGALAKVAANKIVRGDRFDVLGAEGAAAFITGAVDGALNAIAPVAGKVGEGFAIGTIEESAAAAAK
ncbi:MAG TPA: hypothetical protein VGF84_21340, partial [Micromonosporaceae bacterium]